MKYTEKNRGFTLIELLIVVLIIGILAAVALPQYQKIIFKSRLMQVSTAAKTYMQIIDAYLLEQGFPGPEAEGRTNAVFFTGTESVADISFGQVFDKKRYNVGSFIKIGNFTNYCDHTTCMITFFDDYNTDGTSITSNSHRWLHGYITISKHADQYDQQWILYSFDTPQAYGHDVCQWWAEQWGVEHIRQEVKNYCASQGIK